MTLQPHVSHVWVMRLTQAVWLLKSADTGIEMKSKIFCNASALLIHPVCPDRNSAGSVTFSQVESLTCGYVKGLGVLGLNRRHNILVHPCSKRSKLFFLIRLQTITPPSHFFTDLGLDRSRMEKIERNYSAGSWVLLRFEVWQYMAVHQSSFFLNMQIWARLGSHFKARADLYHSILMEPYN